MMKLIEKRNDQMIFQAEIEESLANAIRRYINHIPVLAIDEVEILRNDSPLYDETIAHRLGLLPLKMDKFVNEKTEVKVKLVANKEGMVNSGEIKGKIKMVYDNTPITLLNKSQGLEIIATARVGKGIEHSKFSPGLIFYRNIFDVKMDKDCPIEVVEICPKKVFELSDGRVSVADNFKCDMCEACIEICRKKKKDSIKIVPTKELVITIESFGQMDVKSIIKKSIEVLKKDLSDIAKKISK